MPSDAATSETSVERGAGSGREFGIIPCGLGARNTLRLEAKMALYGHEISDTINVWEAGLDRYCKMEKGDFIGRAALEQGISGGTDANASRAWKWWIVASLAMNTSCWMRAGEQVGVITSGSPSPRFARILRLAYVPPSMAAMAQRLFVEDSHAKVQSAGGGNSVLQAAEENRRIPTKQTASNLTRTD